MLNAVTGMASMVVWYVQVFGCEPNRRSVMVRSSASQRRQTGPESMTPRASHMSGTHEDTQDEDDVRVVPAKHWPWIAGTLICLAGLGVAAYETLAHYDTHVVLACPNTGVVNCALVTNSVYSEILGIPVALLGLIFFFGMLLLQLPWAWQSANPYLRTARVLGSSAGVGMIIWLLYVELFRLDHICLECTAVHVLTLLLFVTTLFGTVATTPQAA